MTIQNCPKCGGIHFGSNKCPYTFLPCVVCGKETIFACSDCAIDTDESIHVCQCEACRNQHEVLRHARDETEPAKPGDFARRYKCRKKSHGSPIATEATHDIRSDLPVSGAEKKKNYPCNCRWMPT